jgi:hypothetical protein
LTARGLQAEPFSSLLMTPTAMGFGSFPTANPSIKHCVAGVRIANTSNLKNIVKQENENQFEVPLKLWELIDRTLTVGFL